MKQCSKCGEEKELAAVKTDQRKSDGKAMRCKACTAIDNIEWRKRNPAIANRRMLPRKPYKPSAEAIKRRRARVAKWRKDNAEKHRQSERKWRLANPEKARAIKAARLARKRGAIGRHTGGQIKALFIAQKGKCPGCLRSIKNAYHVDHVMPLALGGSNDIGNIQLLCAACNLAKNAKLPEKWAQENGRLL